MEEYGRDWCICGTTFIIKSGRQLLAQLHHDGKRTFQFWPEQSDCTARMAHVSH